MEGSPEEIAEVKAWLRQLRKQHGLTQSELAALMGVKERTVLNAESLDAGLPRGLPFLRMLQALEVVGESPGRGQTVTDRLAALEEQVGEGAKEVVLSLQDLAERVHALERGAGLGGGSATGGLAE